MTKLESDFSHIQSIGISSPPIHNEQNGSPTAKITHTTHGVFVNLSVVPKILLATHVKTETNAEQELDFQTIELFHRNTSNTGIMSIRIKIIIVGFGS